MAAPKTVKTYDLNGTLKDFPITFEYLARKFVTVTLIGTDRRELILNTDYRFSTPTQITTLRATGWGPADGYDMIEIRRVTSATDRLVDFADGSILRAFDLNTSQVQSLHIAEEARDLTADTIGVNDEGNLDARAKRIVNVADPVDLGDVVTLRYELDHAASTLGNKVASEAAATASEVSRQASLTQANASAASASASQTSRVASEAARDASLTYSNNSSASSTLASKWASELEDIVVSGGKFSAYHWSLKATAQATIATTQAGNSATSASESQTSRLASEAARDLSLEYSLDAAASAAAAAGVGLGYIDGLIPTRSVTLGLTVTFGTGCAVMPATGKVLTSSAPITAVLSGFAANTWAYAYLYDSGTDVAAIEWSATAPAAPYFGTARTKTGDTSRRFLCALKVNAAANAVQFFQWRQDHIRVLASANAAPWRVITVGVQTSPTIVSLTAAVPPTTERAIAIASLSAATPPYDVYFGTPDTGATLTSYVEAPANSPSRSWIDLPTDSLQRINFWVGSGGAGQGLTLDVIGYGNER